MCGLLLGALAASADRTAFSQPAGSGYRASIAASFLKRGGYEDVTNVLGGIEQCLERGQAADDEILKPGSGGADVPLVVLLYNQLAIWL